MLDSEDAEAIRAKTEALAQVSMKLGEAMYKAQAGAAGEPGGGAAAGGRQRRRGDVVDADFEEVDDDARSRPDAAELAERSRVEGRPGR